MEVKIESEIRKLIEIIKKLASLVWEFLLVYGHQSKTSSGWVNSTSHYHSLLSYAVRTPEQLFKKAN